MNRKFAVLGSPISHSKSPDIHQAAYRVLGEEWQYDRFEVVKGGLKRFIENEGSDYAGFSVTMPLKENAFAFADVPDELSKLTGATNTLTKIDNRWFGYNTDVFGIMQAISAKASAPEFKSLVIGSGATATSALVAISKLNPGSEVRVFARNKASRAEILKFGESLGLKMRRTFGFVLVGALAKSDLVISTLPGGALDAIAKKLEPRTSFRPRGLLLDVAYAPWPSAIASLWQSRGGSVTSGKEMLLWQAVAQIRIFKNQSPTEPLLNEIAVVEAMRIALGE